MKHLAIHSIQTQSRKSFSSKKVAAFLFYYIRQVVAYFSDSRS